MNDNKQDLLLEARENLIQKYHELSKNIDKLEPEDLKRMHFIGTQLKGFDMTLSMLRKGFSELWRYVDKKKEEKTGVQKDEYRIACIVFKNEIANYLNSYSNATK